MEDRALGNPDEGRARYIWDREKLAWVESAANAEAGAIAPQATADMPLEASFEEVGSIATPLEDEGLQLRGAWIRFFGLALDFLVLIILQSIVQAIFGSESVVADFLIPLIGVVYFVGFWTMRGQTLGKMAIGARVVRLDGSPVGLARSFLRYLVFLAYFFAMGQSAGASVWLAIVIGVVVFSIVALSRSKRGLHDLAAGTMVINSRPRLMEDYAEEVWEAPEEESEVYVADEDED
jgi:uncharacterized RDD family membrane protein YckC